MPDKNPSDNPTPRQRQRVARDARLAKALKDNVKRRRQQAQRRHVPQTTSDEDEK